MSKSVYSSKVLELVAKEVSGYFTGNEIVKILMDFGMEREIIQYPNTKWWTINEAFKYIKQNYEKPEDAISRLIMNFLHPLQHNLNDDIAGRLAEKVEKYLGYDNFYIENTGKEYLIFSDEEMEEIHASSPESIEEDKNNEQKDIEKIKSSIEIIKTLRDHHQAYMDVIEVFCQNSKKPTKELNDAYLFLVKKIENILKQIDLKHYRLFFYRPFKNDLYTAEIEWNGTGDGFDMILGPKLSWDAVRPRLYEAHSTIIKIQNMIDEPTEMTDDEKQLEKINTLISEKRAPKETQKKTSVIPEKIIKHEHSHKFENSIQEKDIQIKHQNEKKPEEYYITKNNSGDYVFEDKTIYIKSKDADYVIIFDVAYSLRPQGGKIEYKKIIEQCKKRKLTVDKKGILRALSGKDANLFKYVKDLKQEPKYGISLFVAMQDGKNIEFNNKK